MAIPLEEAVELLYNQPNNKEIVQSCYFDQDILQASDRFWKSDEFRAVMSILRPQRRLPLASKILDLGAGRGIASYAFAKEGYDVMALEPDSSSIVGTGTICKIINRTKLPIKIVEGLGEELPFQDNHFDIVYIRQVLHHAKNLRKLCQEIYRVLKPAGLFLATREHVLSKKEDLPTFQKNHLLHYLTGDENAFLLSEYIEAIAKAGFEIQNVWGPYDTIINYFPSSSGEIKLKSSTLLQPLIPAKLLRPFMKIQPIFSVCSRNLSRKDNTPGRLYSFLAGKI